MPLRRRTNDRDPSQAGTGKITRRNGLYGANINYIIHRNVGNGITKMKKTVYFLQKQQAKAKGFMKNGRKPQASSILSHSN